MAGRIEIERDDRGVETIWLNNQDHRNTLNNILIDDMAAAVHRSSSDDQCHVIIIRGRGGVFCAGRELRDLAALLDADISLIQATYHRLRMLNEALYLCRKPTIAVVEKYAFGAGATLASWCDIAIAEDDASFAYPEVRHGIVPSPIVMALNRGAPRKAIMDLILTGRRIDGREAALCHIITRAVAKTDLETNVEATISNILKGSPDAIARTKDFIVHAEDASMRSAMLSAVDSISIGLTHPETRRRISAFLAGAR
jgi:enoyl-CoA hydratase/carnithine racemase